MYIITSYRIDPMKTFVKLSEAPIKSEDDEKDTERHDSADTNNIFLGRSHAESIAFGSL